LADPLSPYIAIIQLIVERFDSYMSRAQRQKEMEAARILKSANILTISLRELDNSFKSETSKLRALRASWSDSERQEIESRVRRFAEQEVILPNIERAVEELSSFASRSGERYAPLVRELANYGERIISSARGACDFTTCFSEFEMERLLQELYLARDENAAQGVREKARDMLNIYDRTVLALAERRFGTLKDMILSEYPNIPQPL
jgi:hypothetical protein